MAKLTPEQISEIAERREAGWSYDRLAKAYGVSTGAIHYQCLRQGAKSPTSTGLRKQQTPRSYALSDGGEQRRFTVAEDGRMQELARDGHGPSFIARAMKRPATSVRIRLMTLALHEDEAA